MVPVSVHAYKKHKDEEKLYFKSQLGKLVKNVSRSLRSYHRIRGKVILS